MLLPVLRLELLCLVSKDLLLNPHGSDLIFERADLFFPLDQCHLILSLDGLVVDFERVVGRI